MNKFFEIENRRFDLDDGRNIMLYSTIYLFFGFVYITIFKKSVYLDFSWPKFFKHTGKWGILTHKKILTLDVKFS